MVFIFFSYFFIGRSMFPQFTDGSSYKGILRFETIFEKNVIKNWRHFSIIYNLIILHYPTLRTLASPLSEENGYIVFQNNLLSVTFFWFKLLRYSKVFKFCFKYQRYTQISLLSVSKSIFRDWFFRNLFLSLVQSIIVFVIFSFIKRLLLAHIYFDFFGTHLSTDPTQTSR